MVRGADRSELDFRGDLQAEVMAAIWKLGQAKVDDVRAQLPPKRQSAYNTIQTVMNRLADRGLLTRERQGNAFIYRPRFAESEYLARSIEGRLAAASPDTRRAALVTLVEGLEGEELDDIARLAKKVKRGRSKR